MKTSKETRSSLPVIGAALLSCVALLSQSCEDKAEINRLKAKKNLLERSVEMTNKKIDRLREDISGMESGAKHAAEASKGIDLIVQNRRDAQIAVEELEPRLEALAAVLEAYRDIEKIEQPVKEGEVLGNVKMADGAILQNAVIMNKKGDKLGIKHAQGVGFYSVSDMPQSVKDRLLKPLDLPVSASDIDPLAVLDSKPASLMTYAAAAAERAAKTQEAWDKEKADRNKRADAAREVARQEALARKQEMEAANAARIAKAEQEKLQREADEKAMREKNEEIGKLRAQVASINSAIYTVKSERSSKHYSMNSGSTRISQADQGKILESYDQKVRAYQQQVAALEQKIAQLSR